MPDLRKFSLGSDEPAVDSQGVVAIPPKDVVDDEVVGLHALVKEVLGAVTNDAPEKVISQAPQTPEKPRGYKIPQHHITRREMINSLRHPEQQSATQTSSSESKPVTPSVDVEDEIDQIWQKEKGKPTINQQPSGKYKKVGGDANKMNDQ